MKFKVFMDIWKIKSLTPLDKNVLHQLLVNSHLDKSNKYLKNITTHPLCNSYKNDFRIFQTPILRITL